MTSIHRSAFASLCLVLSGLAPSASNARTEVPARNTTSTGIVRHANRNVVREIGRVNATTATCSDVRREVFRNDAAYVTEGSRVRVAYRSNATSCASDSYLAPAHFRTTDSPRCEAGYVCVDFEPPGRIRDSSRLRLLDEMREPAFEAPRFQGPNRRW